MIFYIKLNTNRVRKQTIIILLNELCHTSDWSRHLLKIGFLNLQYLSGSVLLDHHRYRFLPLMKGSGPLLSSGLSGSHHIQNHSSLWFHLDSHFHTHALEVGMVARTHVWAESYHFPIQPFLLLDTSNSILHYLSQISWFSYSMSNINS